MKEFGFPILLVFLIGVVITYYTIRGHQRQEAESRALAAYVATEPVDSLWRGGSVYDIRLDTDSGELILYGRELIARTAYYLGPHGIVAQISNGLNCQNCHLEAGTLPFANNFGKVYATYPQFRMRSNSLQTIYGRINDCMERSLDGRIMDSAAHEMRAMYAYIKWLGQDIPKGEIRGGTSNSKLKYLDSAADPLKGHEVYIAKCQSCHGDKGQGQSDVSGTGYVYPPLWGEHSYNDGAGMFRLSSFAGFVKNNMPFGTDYHNPKLTDEEAWNVAAFVNSRPRPHKDQSADWKNIAKKPVDYPFGPYVDTFSAQQHKYGPFSPIAQFLKTK